MENVAANTSEIPGGAPSSRIAFSVPEGFEYAVRILLGCSLVWYTLHHTHLHSPLWALISVITVTEPKLHAAWRAFLSRILNTVVGAATGMLVLYMVGPGFGEILFAIMVSILICTHLIKVPGSWRLAPVTVAIVMTTSVLVASRAAGNSTAIDRTEEVLIGSLAALLITLVATVVERYLARLMNQGPRGNFSSEVVED
jgi:uncharacterized membrane protein YccC